MANLTAGRHDKREEGVLIAVPYGANTVYAGGLVCADASGNAKAGTSALAGTFLGVAMENSADAKAEGRAYVRVWAEGTFEFNLASAAATDLGAKVILAGDDTTVAKAVVAGDTPTTFDKIIGKIVEVTDTTNGKVRVKIA